MRIDHVAHPCYDPHQTHRFYATVLGLKLVQAYAGNDLMLVYALPDGGSLVFSTGTGGMRPRDDDSDWERRHVGLAVGTRAEFERWLRRLKECGIRHKLIDDERVYFSDPDGLVLELEVASLTPINPVAPEILARWQPDSR
jgi:catechol 2,3-dioxygenase-like lactoylglutathione lyase family enzyme